MPASGKAAPPSDELHVVGHRHHHVLVNGDEGPDLSSIPGCGSGRPRPLPRRDLARGSAAAPPAPGAERGQGSGVAGHGRSSIKAHAVLPPCRRHAARHVVPAHRTDDAAGLHDDDAVADPVCTCAMLWSMMTTPSPSLRAICTASDTFSVSRERRGRLVEQQQAAAEVARTGDGERLALAPDRMSTGSSGERRVRPISCRFAIVISRILLMARNRKRPAGRLELPAEEEVPPHAERRDQREILVDRLDPDARVSGRAEPDRAPLELHHAAAGA